MTDSIEIYVGDVTDVEARVFARYVGAEKDGVVLRGTLRGPNCEVAQTLPAEFVFRDVNSATAGVFVGEAVVTDPCLWSAELPHLYDVDVEAWQGERMVAGYHGRIGLRRLAPRRPVDFAPGTG
jgi:beta-galactosidase/beta-glucuronidase